MMAKKGWIQKSRERMERKGTVGALTRQAKAAGHDSALSFARQVLRNKEKYDTRTVRRALWAVNVAKSRKK